MIVTRELPRISASTSRAPRLPSRAFGNVGSVSADLLAAAGEDRGGDRSDKGGVHNEAGLDIARSSPTQDAQDVMTASRRAEPLDNDDLLGARLDVLVPAALENQNHVRERRRAYGYFRAMIVTEGAPTGRPLNARGAFSNPPRTAACS
jgi:glutamate dehydrogenase (NAD(P)+)